MRSAVHRVRQFLLAAEAWGRSCLERPSGSDERGLGLHGLAELALPPAAARLFQSMPSYDRRHALRVAQLLRERGQSGPDLLAAALLHDVGKSGGQRDGPRLWHRVAAVLMRRLWPGLLARIAQDRPGSWRQPFFVQRHHAALGAELALQAGCSAVTAELIRRHEDREGTGADPLLAALQAADDEA